MGYGKTLKINKAKERGSSYITAAYQVFENWPHNFHQFLDAKSKGNVRLNPRDGKLDTALKEEFGASDDDQYISVTEARRLLKISHASLLDLVKTGEIPFVIKNQDRTLRYILRLRDVERVKLTFEQAVGPRELAKQVGVDHTVISQLVQDGRIQRKSRRTVDGYHSPKFDLDTARRLLQTRDQFLN